MQMNSNATAQPEGSSRLSPARGSVPFASGQLAVVRVPIHGRTTHKWTRRWNDHFWGVVKIVTVSQCGRYAVIQGTISWSERIHQTQIPTKFLKHRKAPNE